MSGKQNILITGANGYLGSHITEYLYNSGHNIYALCLEIFEEQKKWEKAGITVIQADITDSSCFAELSKYSFDTIIHLVSLNHFDSEKDTELALKVNVLPTWNLLKFFSGRGLKKFIYFSTQQVYGRIPAENINEFYQPKPVNSYGLTHLQSEQIVNLYNITTEVDGINIRLSNSFGAPVFEQNSCWWLVVNDLCKSAYVNKEIKLLSDGSPQRDFIHVSDVAQAIQLLVGTKNLQNNLFNISSGTTYTILELANIVRKVYFKKYKKDIQICNKEGVAFEPNEIGEWNIRMKIDPGRLNELGFVPKTDLETGISDLFCSLEKNNIKYKL